MEIYQWDALILGLTVRLDPSNATSLMICVAHRFWIPSRPMVDPTEPEISSTGQPKIFTLSERLQTLSSVGTFVVRSFLAENADG